MQFYLAGEGLSTNGLDWFARCFMLVIVEYEKKYTCSIFFLYLKIVFIIANSADPDEMQHDAAFHLGLHCLPKYPSRGFQYKKG